MIDLICSQCQTKLPVAESKLGTRVFICPKCANPLEAPAPATPKEAPKPAVSEQSEDQTMAPDTSAAYVQEKLREAAAKRAAKAKEPAEAPKKKPTPPIKSGLSKGLLFGIAGVGGVFAAAVIGVVVFIATRDRPAPIVLPNKDLVQVDEDKKPRERASVETLAKILKDGPASARKQALLDLKERGPAARPALAAVLDTLKNAELRPLAQETLTRMGPATKSDLPIYAAALRDPAPELRVYGAGQLAELGQDAKSELVYLRVLALDENPLVGDAAQKAVQRLEDELLANLTKGLQDKSPAVRGKAARELADMGHGAKAALPSLVEALADNNSAVRLAVLDVFVAIGPDAIMVLGEALRDKNPQIRLTAINALGRMGPDARFVLPDLIAVTFGPDPKAKEETLQALARIGEYSIPYVMQALEREKNPARQKPLIEALERMGPSAAPALMAALKAANPEVTKAAAQVISKIEAQPKPPPRKDHTGQTGLIQSQLRGLFAASDTNKDGFLDKDELARAIRNPKAKAYDFTPEGKPARPFGPRDFDKYPDFAFLCRVDRDNDGKISRDEFEAWAYDYAEFLKKDKDNRDRIMQAQLRLQEQGISQAMRLQREGAVANLWAAYNNQRSAQSAFNRDVGQVQWLQRWTLNNLPRR